MFSKKLLIKNNDNWDLRWSSTIIPAMNNASVEVHSWSVGSAYDIMSTLLQPMIEYNSNNQNDQYPIVNIPSNDDRNYMIWDHLGFDEDDMWGTGFDETIIGWILKILQLYITMDARYLFTGWFTPGFTDFANCGTVGNGTGNISEVGPEYYDSGDGAPTYRTLWVFEVLAIIEVSGATSFAQRYIDPILSNCANLTSDLYNFLNGIKAFFNSCKVEDLDNGNYYPMSIFSFSYDRHNTSKGTKMELIFEELEDSPTVSFELPSEDSTHTNAIDLSTWTQLFTYLNDNEENTDPNATGTIHINIYGK